MTPGRSQDERLLRVKKDGWRCSRIASCALDSGRSVRGGAPAPRSHDLPPSVILNTVMDEQQPRLEVQRNPDIPHCEMGSELAVVAVSEKRRSCFAWASRMQIFARPLRLGRQAFFSSRRINVVATILQGRRIAQSLCRGNVAQRVCWPPVPRPHTQAPSDDHGAENR